MTRLVRPPGARVPVLPCDLSLCCYADAVPAPAEDLAAGGHGINHPQKAPLSNAAGLRAASCRR